MNSDHSKKEKIYITAYESPAGWLTIVSDGKAVTGISFGRPEQPVTEENGLNREVIRQLKEYFAGKRREFSLPLSPAGTEFQKKVWSALQEIPYGETRTYKEIAGRCGNEKACRAVGMANHVNPIGIVIPCHRVVGSSGKMVGYAGGLDKKQYLLELEGGKSLR